MSDIVMIKMKIIIENFENIERNMGIWMQHTRNYYFFGCKLNFFNQ